MRMNGNQWIIPQCREMTEKYLDKYLRAMKLGTTGDTGSGIALGVSAGGVADRLSTATAWRFINPPVDWPKGMIVNLQGKRYVNEALYGAVIGTKMMRDNNGECILILDKKLFEQSVANLNLKTARLVGMGEKRLFTGYINWKEQVVVSGEDLELSIDECPVCSGMSASTDARTAICTRCDTHVFLESPVSQPEQL